MDIDMIIALLEARNEPEAAELWRFLWDEAFDKIESPHPAHIRGHGAVKFQHVVSPFKATYTPYEV